MNPLSSKSSPSVSLLSVASACSPLSRPLLLPQPRSHLARRPHPTPMSEDIPRDTCTPAPEASSDSEHYANSALRVVG